MEKKVASEMEITAVFRVWKMAEGLGVIGLRVSWLVGFRD